MLGCVCASWLNVLSFPSPGGGGGGLYFPPPRRMHAPASLLVVIYEKRKSGFGLICVRR